MNHHYFSEAEDTIAAIATPSGSGALAIIRVSGKEAIDIVNKIFYGKDLSEQDSHTVHFGTIRDGDKILDEVLVSIFRAPRSFTRENAAEISCHGSEFIIRQIIQLLIRTGARTARPGEFTKRAFLNGKMDLAQAEAVADLINSDSEAAHMAALNQMRGGFSLKIKQLREQLIHFASMIELELDFAEEDVEFADREKLKQLVSDIKQVTEALISSFDLGNVVKNGVPTVIAGKPNAGKSTLLNALLNEEKAMVSDIPGTTRDFIEDEINIGGITFRFTDTAGLRETVDKLEAMGIERTREKMKKASLIIYLFDVNSTTKEELSKDIEELQALNIPFIAAGNKIDADKGKPEAFQDFEDITYISARDGIGLDELKDKILGRVNAQDFKTGNTMVTNLRHYESLVNTKQALLTVLDAIDNGVTGDFLAMDIRNALHYLGEITGEITNEDLLDNIFSKFCIGK
ncbi:tRNA uridine-5-carboxymethylaminomethyl(34) synthesis GTPase MnmE [Cytophagaceae bacterium ABcell3]|nr:tRNA uridine-5-carboxymethylaminomethyl(34) synthesis GTPase MnmE [Cytophagaceae bacterium ABcell3]